MRNDIYSLSEKNLSLISSAGLSKPPQTVFGLPEKVLQFGTGVLLRGLCDYFVSRANELGIFNGRIVVVKSTSRGDTQAFIKQNNLYTLCVRGIDNGKELSENQVCSAISRVLSANEDWNLIMESARNAQMQVVISNTTEVGISLVKESIFQKPPASFPGKLLAFLYERFTIFNGDPGTGMIIIPTELISNNGEQLSSVVQALALYNELGDKFMSWLKNDNHFCNSLVDRIVTGKPDAIKLQQMQDELGYEDELLTICEVYRLWAIEGNEQVKRTLSFHAADPGVVIQPDIESFRALKLHLLNGTHTLSCGLAYLYGANLVKEVMSDKLLSDYVSHVMQQEIGSAIPYALSREEITAFALKVLDRFRNPFVEHLLLNITMQYSAKMKMRNIPVLLQYYTLYHKLPRYMCTGFAAYLLFMKAAKKEKEEYYGQRNAGFYLINDDKAGYFYEVWQQSANAQELVSTVLKNQDLWGTDLSQVNGLADETGKQLESMMVYGIAHTLNALTGTE